MTVAKSIFKSIFKGYSRGFAGGETTGPDQTNLLAYWPNSLISDGKLIARAPTSSHVTQQVKSSGFLGAGSSPCPGLLTTDTITASGPSDPTCSVAGTLTFPGPDCWDIDVHRAGVLWASWKGINAGKDAELDASGNGHHLIGIVGTTITERLDGSGTNWANEVGFTVADGLTHYGNSDWTFLLPVGTRFTVGYEAEDGEQPPCSNGVLSTYSAIPVGSVLEDLAATGSHAAIKAVSLKFSGAQYGTLASSVTLVGDFLIRFKIELTADTQQTILGSNSTNSLVWINTGRGVWVFIGGTGYNLSGIVLALNVESLVTIWRVGTVVFCSIDDQTVMLAADAKTDNFVFSVFGKYGAAAYLQGYLSEVYAEDSGGVKFDQKLAQKVGTVVPSSVGPTLTLTGFASEDWTESILRGHSWNDSGYRVADGTGTYPDGAILPLSVADNGDTYSGSANHNFTITGDVPVGGVFAAAEGAITITPPLSLELKKTDYANVLFTGATANAIDPALLATSIGDSIFHDLTTLTIHRGKTSDNDAVCSMTADEFVCTSSMRNDGSNVIKTSPFAFYEFVTSATKLSIKSYNNYYSTYPTLTALGVYVDGVYHSSITPTSDGYNVHSVTLVAGTKRVTVVNGPQSNQTYNVAAAGTFFVSVSANGNITDYSRSAPSERLVIYGDSIAIGQAADPVMQKAWPLQVRSAALSMDVSAEAWGWRTLFFDAGTDVKRGRHVKILASYAPTKIWLAIGTNDYGLASWSAANFGTAYAALLDDLHTLLPSAVIYCQTPILRSVETANGLGSTMADYRTQISNAVSTRTAFCTLIDGTAFMTTASLSDGVHPTTTGHTLYADAVKTVLGL